MEALAHRCRRSLVVPLCLGLAVASLGCTGRTRPLPIVVPSTAMSAGPYRIQPGDMLDVKFARPMILMQANFSPTNPSNLAAEPFMPPNLQSKSSERKSFLARICPALP